MSSSILKSTVIDRQEWLSQNVAYPFNGFHYWIKQKSSGDYLLLDKSGEKNSLAATSVKRGCSKPRRILSWFKKVDEKLYGSTRFIFMDESGSSCLLKKKDIDPSSFLTAKHSSR